MTDNENNIELTPAEETPKAEETLKAEEAPAAAPENPPAAKKQKMPAGKKSMIGIIIAVIAVVVLIVLIVADGAKSKKAEAEALAAAEAEAAAAAEAAEAAEAEAALSAAAFNPDFEAAYAKYAPDDVVYKLDGTPVYWRDYYCWLYSVIGQLTNNYGITDWTMVLDEASGLTVADYILDYAEGMGSQYTLIHNKADALGITLDAADQAKISEIAQSDADAYYGGDLDALYAYLAENYYTTEYYDYMNATPVLYEKMFAEFYGEDGENLSESDVRAFLDEHGYLHAKHILLKTTDDSNQSLEEKVVAEKKAQAEELLAQLSAVPAGELDAKFDALMQEYSEDPGSLSYPDGYYFQSGEMVPEFEAAAQALSEGGLSDIVESTYGYHILYCPEMHGDDLFDYGTDGLPVSLRRSVANGLFSNTVADWLEAAEIVYAPGFELNLFELFNIA